MSHKQKIAARIDENQPDIVAALRRIPGVTVQLGMDDILVGYKGNTYWFEIKDPKKCFKADKKTFKKGAIKDSQVLLSENWKGHYEIVWSVDQVLNSIGIIST